MTNATKSSLILVTSSALGALLLTACLTPSPASAGDASSASTTVTGGSASRSTVKSVPYAWKSVVIRGGGFVTGIIFSRAKQGLLYIRTDIGGAYRYDSANKGWIPVTDFIGQKEGNYLGIESIAADPVDANRVYMAVGMYTQSWAGPGAFMRSDNQGDSWKLIPTPNMKMGGNELGRSNGERLAIDPHQRKTLFFGSRRNGLWKSTNEADSWSKVESFPMKEDDKGLGIPFVVFDPNSGKPGEPTPVIYAGATRKEDNMYRSVDGGATWQLLPKQPKGFLPARMAIDRDGTVYVAYGNDPGPYAVQDGALYRYDPKHETWTDIAPIKHTDTDRFGWGAITVDPQHPGTLLAATIDRWSTGAEVFRSLDSGKTWKPLMAKAELDSGGAAHVYHGRAKLEPPQWVGDIEIDPFDAKRAMEIEGGGVWLTEDLTHADTDQPTHWSFHTKNLEETAVSGLISPPEGAPLLSVMGDMCGFRHDSLDESPKNGKFSNPMCASGNAIDFAGKKPAVMARVGTYPWDDSKGPRGAVSKDGGIHWTEFGAEPPGSAGSGAVAVSADGGTIVWAPKEGKVGYSVDGGATWQVADGIPDAAKVPDWAPSPLRVAADRVNQKKIYAFDGLTGTAYFSSDGGAHFKIGSRGLPSLPEYDLISASIVAVPGIEGDVWITSGKELVHSTDSGHDYALVTSVDESYSLGFGKAAPGRSYPALYLSGKVDGLIAFYRSDDGGSHFARINDDAHQYGGSHMLIGDPRIYGRVYVAVGGRGIVYGDPK
ncbi:MAG TPA: sialidase family protein [Polyangiaceae bacterium]